MSESYFAQVRAPSKEAIARLGEYDLDLFRHTARKSGKHAYTIDGLLTPEQAEQLVKEGYVVELQRAAQQAALGAAEVIELPEWLAERGF